MSDFTGLNALFINTSLKKKSSESHTKLLLNASANIMADQGVAVELVHMLDHEVPPGVYPDMTEQGWARDDWPMLWDKVKTANILVIGTPLWLGEESSVCRGLIERLYGMSGKTNDKGQSIYYGKTGGCVITGNEDGIKHTAMTIQYALSHLGYTVPPQADCGWIGEAGPGPSYGDELDDGSKVGFDNDFTKRNMTIMTWNLMHIAHLLRDGLPNKGNDRRALDGIDINHDNPEYRS
ncbi:flavodoxin family protein [Thalassorhabdomicrobium marinisediminis]|uniref:flavodoxin family protein n=1 Tax=Thalassorhabdomicrobium marinisediminis TaxID=2170577 RepID=UPI0024931E4B|nr:NAD(P)H-dependent oxidoreductase [Thalassorhabdomicrobium marinisediminis]